MTTGDIQDEVQEIFKKCEHWLRLGISINIHIKEALINVVHNNINDSQVKAIPSDPADLYKFLQIKKNKNKIQNSPFIRQHQKSILLPTNSQSVDSSSFDISITRFLIHSFSGIANARGNWTEPDQNDQTLCAYVFRAAGLRNSFAHDNNIKGLNATEFETKWNELEEILKGLKYDVNKVNPFKNEPFDLIKYEQHVLLEEFVDHLRSYKEECTKEKTQDHYVLRRFYVNRNEDNIITESDSESINKDSDEYSLSSESDSESTSDDNDEKDIVTESDLESLIKDNDRLLIYGEAGLGKTSTARRLKNEWFNKKILNGHHLIYYDSKKMGKQVKVKSFAAPLYFSELWDYLNEKGRTEDDLSIYKCVRTTINDLVIIIDGIDEFPIKELFNGNSIDELEKKIKNNEDITAAETIIAIYFGFIFPFSKIILLGRIGEFGHLKEVNEKRNTGIFNRRNIDLELLKFDDANVKDFTCNKMCNRQEHGQICSEACKKMYEKIKNIELRKIPTDLNSLIELYKKNPNENIGRITRTKLIIATLKNRLINHINQRINFKFKSFRKISEQKDLSNYLECIRKMSEISFQILLEDNSRVKVDEKEGKFIYKEIKVERKIFEELDFFYVRDLEYNSILEPHHTIDIEFLSACYLFSNECEWESILKLNEDRQLVIISFIAGLHADDNFTKDFVLNVLNTSKYSLKNFFRWLYNVEDVRQSLPIGGDGYYCWFGLMETQKLSPSLFLLDSISHEVEIPQTYIPTKTIVCYYYDYISISPSFEWYNMNYLKHNFLTKLSDKLNIELFLNKFQQYEFIIKGYIWITNNDEFNLLNKCGNNNRITFRINDLYINTSLNTSFSCNFDLNKLEIKRKCDSRTIDMILNALSPPTTNTSSSNSQPAIKCKQLCIRNISKLFNSQQTEKLLELDLSGVVDYIRLWDDFFTDGQLAILENAERKANKMLNIELGSVKFSDMFGLPSLGNRHVSLFIALVTNNDLIKLRKHIPTGYANNLTNFDKYKIIDYDVPFVRKEKSSQDRIQSMFLNLYYVDFTKVSPKVFAEAFSLIPSLSFFDNSKRYEYIPSSHWSRLSQINNCRLNEMRIWTPRPENFEHFLIIKTSLLQLVFESKDELKGLLNYIVTTTNIQFDKKQIKIFIVKCDDNDWDYYAEVPVFSDKTIEEYKINHCSYDLLLDNISVKFHEGELHLKWWCCEISLPIQKDIDSVSDDKMTGYCYEDFLVIDIPNQSDDQENIDSDDKMTSYYYEDFLVIDIPNQKDVDVNSPCDQI